MQIVAATEAGDGTCNEDYYATTPTALVVVDGATVRTDTGCTHGVAWYSRQLGTAIIAGMGEPHLGCPVSLTAVLRQAISHVAALHPECDLAHPGTPSAAVGIVEATPDGHLRTLVLGDVTIVVDTAKLFTTAEPPLVITDGRIRATAPVERAAVHRHERGSREWQAAMQAMKHLELAARNIDGGYWIAAADPDAAYHALVDSFPEHEWSSVLAMTDGVERLVDLFGHTWREVLGLAVRSGPARLIEVVRWLEKLDPAGQVYARNKPRDDATVVLMTASSPAIRPTPVNPAWAAGATREQEVLVPSARVGVS